MAPLVDLTEPVDRQGRRVINDRRGYAAVFTGPGFPQTYRLRVCWSSSRPQDRHWHYEVRLPDGRWWAGAQFTQLIPSGSA